MADFPFHFDLPVTLIAQEPCEPRDQARLLVARRADASCSHGRVGDLPDLLTAGDLLVFNDTRVVPARLMGKRGKSGGKWQGLFLRAHEHGSWELLSQTRGRLREGEWIDVEPGPLRLRLVERLPGGRWRAVPEPAAPWEELLERHGQTPLPPYIRKGIAHQGDRERYQTVYARTPGAVAAPTAGLHFTPRLLQRLREHGVEHTFVTLHVGLGTFRPIEAADYRTHPMHAEWGSISPEAAAAIRDAKSRGGRVIAVGTTTVRLLESAAPSGGIDAWSGETSLFIYPPYTFHVVDALLTNFHLPRSTLLLLVCAFAGVDLIQRAYQLAIAERYRFFSYGDAMLIL